jgi:hypothetical protein
MSVDIGILADPSREKDLGYLVDKAAGIFDRAFFIPSAEVRIESSGRKVFYEKMELSSLSCVLPVPSTPAIFLPIIIALEENVYVPYGPKTLLAFQRRTLGLSMLRNAGLSTPDLHYAITDRALKETMKSLSYPINVHVGQKSSLVEDEKHLASLLKLRKSGQAIIIEEPRPEKMTGCMVVDKELAAAVEVSGKKMKLINVGHEMKDLAVKVVETLGSPYGYVLLDGSKVISFSLSPPLAAIRNAGKDVSGPLLRYLKINVKPPQKKGFLENILDNIRAK